MDTVNDIMLIAFSTIALASIFICVMLVLHHKESKKRKIIERIVVKPVSRNFSMKKTDANPMCNLIEDCTDYDNSEATPQYHIDLRKRN